MQSAPLRPARLAFDQQGLPFSPDYADVYHAAAGAFAQAEHVFLRGNGLPGRWAGRERFVILEAGFGLGNNFLAAWAAWRADAVRCERLVFISIDKHPLQRGDLVRAHAASPEPALAAQLVDQWPLLTPNLHLLDFEGGRVQLLLAFGDVQAMLPELQAEVDAFFLDGFAPSRNAEMWSPEVFRRLVRLARPGATAATWSVARSVRDGLSAGGFTVETAPGFAGKREMTVARYAPRHAPRPPAAFRPAHAGPREALIVGGGLAGCAAAWGLARQGWHAVVLDRQAAPAQETSGNPGGLVHGIVNWPDSPHARWFRAAALHTARWAAAPVAAGGVAGCLEGLWRVDPDLDDPDRLRRAQARLAALGLPPDYAQACDAARVAAGTGLASPHGAWLYGGGGWLSPPDWAAWLLADSGATWRSRCTVAQVRQHAGRWQALDGAGRVLAEAPVLVLAHARGVRDLWPDTLPPLPLQAVRGQTALIPAHWPGLTPPRQPASGQGYGLTLPDGRVLVGATSQPDDMDGALRQADHRVNLHRAAALGVLAPGAAAPLDGRVGWRMTTPSRLPVIGPPADPAPADAGQRHRRSDAPRHRARCHDAGGGLYVFNGLGSRGLTHAALGARVLAAWITGAPFPVENSVRDLLDPARWPPPAAPWPGA